MDTKKSPLGMLSKGKKVQVYELLSTGSDRRRMLDLGLINNTKIEILQKSPSGDPTAYLIRGAVIALREKEAKNIIVEYK